MSFYSLLIFISSIIEDRILFHYRKYYIWGSRVDRILFYNSTSFLNMKCFERFSFINQYSGNYNQVIEGFPSIMKINDVKKFRIEFWSQTTLLTLFKERLQRTFPHFVLRNVTIFDLYYHSVELVAFYTSQVIHYLKFVSVYKFIFESSQYIYFFYLYPVYLFVNKLNKTHFSTNPQIVEGLPEKMQKQGFRHLVP